MKKKMFIVCKRVECLAIGAAAGKKEVAVMIGLCSCSQQLKHSGLGEPVPKTTSCYHASIPKPVLKCINVFPQLRETKPILNDLF